MAVGVALLMIGGHFDLSAGVMTGTAGLVTAITTTQWGLNIWVALLLSLAICLGVGFLNGFMVTRTGLPSFIITLATFLMLQGLNLALTKLITGTVSVGGMATVPFYDTVQPIFASKISLFGVDFKIQIVWWIVITAIGAWVLAKTRFGNWTFAVGGDPVASRNVGVPAVRTTITLFMIVGACAWLVGTLKLLVQTSVQSQSGLRRRADLHRRGGDRRLSAHRRLWLGDRRLDRCTDLRDDQPGHRVCRAGQRLVQVLPGRDAAACGAREPVRPPLRREQEVAMAVESAKTNGTAPLMEIRNVSKFFGSVIALQDITTTVECRPQVTCVLGDNGAGKSTLIKILAGVHQHDAGRVLGGGRAGQVLVAPRGARPRASPPCTRTSRWCR